LFFYALNIIFNLSHPSNHSQTSTNFTLNPLTNINKLYSLCHVSGYYWTVKLVNWSKPTVNSGQNCKNG